MSLESLPTLVKKLRKRIDDHAPALRQSEMQTRYALIDPLLRELGWDTENPALVRPEFQGNGKADYALLIDERPVVIGETKSLKKKNLEEARREGLEYCKKEATRYLFVTNGRYWKIYDTYRKDKRPIVQFDLKDPSAAEVCKKALRKSNVRRKYRQPISISEWNPPPKSCPVKVQFPDNSIISIKSWKSLLVEVARWLIKGNHLKARHCPILCKQKGRTHYAVSTEPFHLSGKRFGKAEPIGLFHVETNGGSEYISIACRTIIERVGQKPAKFKVWFSPSRT